MKQAGIDYYIQILGSCFAQHHHVSFHKLYFGIGVEEEVVEQFVFVTASEKRTKDVLVFVHQFAYSFDEADGFLSCLFYAFEYEEYPFFPLLCVVATGITDGLNEAVVFSFVVGDVPAEVEDRKVEEVRNDKIQDVDDTSGTSVSVIKGVDGFELVMDDGHLDQRVKFAYRRVVYKLFEVAHQGIYPGRLRRRIDNGAVVSFQCRTGNGTEAGAVVLQISLNPFDVIVGQHLMGTDDIEAVDDGFTIVEDLLRRCADDALLEVEVGLIKVVLSGYDILNGGTVLRLLESKGAQQNDFIGDCLCNAFEFGQLSVSAVHLLEYGLGFKVVGQREVGDIVLRHNYVCCYGSRVNFCIGPLMSFLMWASRAALWASPAGVASKARMMSSAKSSVPLLCQKGFHSGIGKCMPNLQLYRHIIIK